MSEGTSTVFAGGPWIEGWSPMARRSDLLIFFFFKAGQKPFFLKPGLAKYGLIMNIQTLSYEKRPEAGIGY